MKASGETLVPRALLVLSAALFVLVLHTGWGKWPDVLIDFGRELYVPWRLNEGEVLARDLAWFNGPLSPYVNALWFRLFGVGFWTLAWANIALLVVFCVLLVRHLAAVSTPIAGAAALAFFLAVFAGGQQVPAGNYNFISPYSHEVTHGLLLGLASLVCARRAGRAERRWLALTGLFVGLVFLTKAEVFLATVGGVAMTFLLRARFGSALRLGVRGVAWLAAAALLPALIAFGLLASALPAQLALETAFGSVTSLFTGGVSDLAYYRHGMGLDATGTNLGRAAVALALFVGAFLPALLLARFQPARIPRAVAACVVFGLTLVVCLALPTTWRWFARALPLALVALLALGVARGRRITDDVERERWGAFLGFATFAFLLLGKMLLQARFGHYGFALAGPAACAVLVFVVGWLPVFALPFASASRATLIAGALGVYAACGADLWHKSTAFFARKNVEVGSGRDRMIADERGLYVNAVLRQLETRLAPGDELLVLPEGITINYLARRRTPTSFVNFMPPELLLFGEANMVAALEANPPAVVVLAHKSTAEYGFPFFGADYGTVLAGWVREHYAHAWTDPRGGYPLQPETRFGISLLEAK